jgi:hypothetical protein
MLWLLARLIYERLQGERVQIKAIFNKQIAVGYFS